MAYFTISLLSPHHQSTGLYDSVTTASTERSKVGWLAAAPVCVSCFVTGSSAMHMVGWP